MFACNQNLRPNRLIVQAALALALLVVLCMPTASVAQHRGGAPGGGGFPGGMPGGEHGGTMGGNFPRPANVPPEMNRNIPERNNPERNSSVRMHGSLQVGPPGRWWDDKHYVKQLHLSDDQQHHMDAIFEQNRPALLKRYESLEQEEQHMEALTHAKTLDEAALFAQIDRIEQARADLSKATLHYLVQLRNELDQDQLSRLEEQH